MILRIRGNEFEIIIENIHDLKEKILYMLSFEKSVNDEQETIRPILVDDNQQELYLLSYKWL